MLAVRFVLPVGNGSAPIRYAELARRTRRRDGVRGPLADARSAVLGLRSQKGMVLDPADHDTWSAGSFFTNPVLTASAYEALIVRAVERGGPAAVPPGFRVPTGW